MVLVGILLFVPLLTAIINKEVTRNVISYIIPMFGLVSVGLALGHIRPAKDTRMGAKEGFIIVSLSWLLMSLFGAIPFVFSGYVDNYITAFFEISSGFTTTGASALTEVELSNMLLNGGKSLLMWRSFSHWIGGMGILVFILAIILESKDGSMLRVLKAESPGPQVGKIVSKMKVSTRILYLIYIVLTLLEILCLNICRVADSHMTFFDSLIVSFGTAGTGGFATTTQSIGYYAPCTQYVVAVFMIIFGTNFTIYYWLVVKHFKDILKNEELRFYILILFLAIFVITLQIYKLYSSFEEGFRHAFFQVASIMSTTGYTTTDYWSGAQGRWPALSLCIILFLMITGACAGSTAGGMKQSRILIVAKFSRSKVRTMISPRKVDVIYLDGKPLEKSVVDTTVSFFIVYFVVLIACTLLISIYNPALSSAEAEPLTMITASLSCISNVGPGLGGVGPAGSFAGFSGFSKIVLSFEMIAGRLELYPILILFSRRTWKKST